MTKQERWGAALDMVAQILSNPLLFEEEVPVVKYRFDDVLWPGGGPAPEYKTGGAAGADLVAAETVDIGPGDRALVRTGLFIELPVGFEAQVRPRSGLAMKAGLTVLNSPGTIDADYRGEVGVLLHNTTSATERIERGDRIAQLVIARSWQATFVAAEALSETDRGDGGFGSTGSK